VPHWLDTIDARHRLLGLALLALHGVVVLQPATPIQVPLLIAHLALLGLWQPFFPWHRVGRYRTLVIAVVATAVLSLGGWLVLALWLIGVIGLLGGELPRARRDQLAQWGAVAYLAVALLAGVTPVLFQFDVAARPSTTWLLYAASLIPVALLAAAAGQLPTPGRRFDFLRSAAIIAVVTTLWAGSALWTYRGPYPYPLALSHALLAWAGVLAAARWLWRRHANETLLDVLWNRYLLNLGTPFEHYLVSLTGPAARSLEPDSYLNQVMASLSNLDWIVGVEARGPVGERLTGQRSPHATEMHDDTVPLIVYTERDPGPALRLHIQMLARLVQQLYLSRVREAELRHQEKARAVYETGARLTHDIKNLLQSLQSLASAVSAQQTSRTEETLQLVQRQLPQINERLEGTLEKLRDPGDVRLDATVSAQRWWDELRARYADADVRFDGRIEGASAVPRELFDTVAENLIENARHKQSREAAVSITVAFTADATGQRLQVCDTGAPMPDEMERSLFSGAIGSANGLGMGLYQCARLAAQLGYELAVTANEPDQVCLRLHGTPPGQSA